MDATAIHEAGHAVMAIRRGVGLDRVTIDPADPSCRSRAPLGELEIKDALLLVCAGAAAESKYLKRAVEMAGDDRDQAIALAGLLTRDGQAPEDVLGRFRTLADAAVVVHWSSIERVAGALTRRGTLSGTDVEKLITEGGETNMRTDEAKQEHQARVAAAAAATRGPAESRPAGGRPAGVTVAEFKAFMGDIARCTKDFVHEKIAAAVQPLERRLADLEQRTYQGIWHPSTTYQAGALVTHDGSLWIARSDSAGVRPGSTHCWQLAARKGADGRPGKDAA